MATCDECGREFTGWGVTGMPGTTYCGQSCKATAETEVAARLILADMEREEKRRK